MTFSAHALIIGVGTYTHTPRLDVPITAADARAVAAVLRNPQLWQYAQRAGAESLMSQAVRACAVRRSRYIGQARTHLQHVLTAVAVNLIRLVAWIHDPHPTPTRISAFARLAATG